VLGQDLLQVVDEQPVDDALDGRLREKKRCTTSPSIPTCVASWQMV
jgi:hypothetical protein